MAKQKDVITAITNTRITELNLDPERFVVKETGKSLVDDTDIIKLSTTPIITLSATEPSNPVVGQIWIDIS